MKPILFELFGVPLASWYVFFAIAGIAAYFLFLYLANKSENRTVAQSVPVIFTLCYVAGWFGARGLSILVEQFEVDTLLGFVGALGKLGPMTFYGGAVFATVVGVAYVNWKKLPFGLLSDCAFPAGVLALGLGRMGCFLNGDDFGKVVSIEQQNAWWAVTFPNLEDGALRYPVQLQEAFFSVLLAGFASWLVLWNFKTAKVRAATFKPGEIAGLTVAVSAVNRFFNEFYRDDARGLFPGTAFSTSQGISVLLIFISLLVLVANRVFFARMTPNAKL